MNRAVLFAVSFALSAASLLPAQSTPPRQQGADVVDRAAQYVADFVLRFSSVVSEELYIQEDIPASATNSTKPSLMQLTRRRELRSDLLLVRLHGVDGWHVFRDVFAVDGQAVRDRDDRLTRLFFEPHESDQAVERAMAIMAEGARFHVGPIGTVDNPLLAFTFLQAGTRGRFRFVVRGTDSLGGLTTRVVEFAETARPTMVRTGRDGDIFARGRYWIVPENGQIARTEVIFLASDTQSTVTTNFAFDARFGVAVPTEMRFRRIVPMNEIRCVATYGAFR